MLASAGVRIESPLPVAASGPAPAVVLTRARRRRIDRVEVTLLLLFGAMSMWVVGLDVWQAVVHNRVWTGTDGFFIALYERIP